MGRMQLRSRRYLRIAVAVMPAIVVLAPIVGVTAVQAADRREPLAKVMFEAGQRTGDASNAVSDGWWGHEGPAKDGGTVPSIENSDPSAPEGQSKLATAKAALGVSDLTPLRIAFVRASKDGSSERPKVHSGESAGEAFEWFSPMSVGTAWVGQNSVGDFVTTVSTIAEYRAWTKAGAPDQVYDDKLIARDALAEGAPISKSPKGKSVLNRWPEGEQISMVLYVSDGTDADGLPIVAAGPDGLAKTAWLTFTTVASPTRKQATSAGYHVVSQPTPTQTSSAGKGDSASVASGEDGQQPGGEVADSDSAGGPGSTAESANPSDPNASGDGTRASSDAASGDASSSSGNVALWSIAAIAALVVGSGLFWRSRRRSWTPLSPNSTPSPELPFESDASPRESETAPPS